MLATCEHMLDEWLTRKYAHLYFLYSLKNCCTIRDTMVEIVCPKCKGALETSPCLYCPQCSLSFPALPHGILPLFCNPQQRIARAFRLLYGRFQLLDRHINKTTKQISESNRKKVLLPIIKALTDNQAVYKKWMDEISDYVDAISLLQHEQSSNRNTYGYQLEYLKRDWSANGTPRGRSHQ